MAPMKIAPAGIRKTNNHPAEATAAVAKETAAVAGLSTGSSTTAVHKNTTTERNAKELQMIAEKEARVAAAEDAARKSTAVMNARALATTEEAIAGPGATFGDVDVAHYYAIKNPSPILPSPSQHADMMLGDGSAVSAQGEHSSENQFVTPIKSTTVIETLSSQSPTSQFEYDIMEATHETLNFDHLHKSRSFARMDDNKSTSFEEALTASYSPGKGLVLRKDEWLPELLKDEVLIRVDATTISTRDCLERLRRNTNKELKHEVWVPGHEIVGHVVRAGTNAEFLLDQRVAALLPYGGGCSRYVCISSKDVIALPRDAGSNDVVMLLSTFMTAYQCLESVVGIEAEVSEESPLIANDFGQEGSCLFGKNVLIFGAGSPVGLALVDLARNAGATVYTVSHSKHLSAIRALGAHYWYRFVQKETWEVEWAGEMDLIVDTLGDTDLYPSLYKVMKTGARLVRANITSCEKKYVPRPERTQFGFGIFGDGGNKMNDKAIDYDVFHSFKEDKELFTKDLFYLLDLLKGGKLRSRIFSRVGFDKLEGEWEKVMSGGANGCVLVSP